MDKSESIEFCKATNCQTKTKGRSYCSKHYHRLRKFGDVNRSLINRGEGKTQEERFWSRVEKTEDCWLWNGSLNEGGYGNCSISINGTRQSLANRVAYFFGYGTEAGNLKVCHTCDNPQCVKPEHLFLGTVKTNMADMASKARSCNGERRANSKLTAENVREIRQIYLEKQINYTELSKKFGVSPSVIRGIILRHRWRHVQ